LNEVLDRLNPYHIPQGFLARCIKESIPKAAPDVEKPNAIRWGEGEKGLEPE
jgi:hypothetical protein